MDKPTIKGIFVNSHINSLNGEKGESAVRELEKRLGKKVDYKNSDDVLVSDEIKILEICLDILSGEQISDKDRAFEAGKLHFNNFTTTPLAKIIFSLFKSQFKLMMINSDKIAGHVFNNVKFKSTDLSPTSVKVVMKNNDYPLDHFRGLFTAWMEYAGLSGIVHANEINEGDYEYTMSWKK